MCDFACVLKPARSSAGCTELRRSAGNPHLFLVIVCVVCSAGDSAAPASSSYNYNCFRPTQIRGAFEVGDLSANAKRLRSHKHEATIHGDTEDTRGLLWRS